MISREPEKRIGLNKLPTVGVGGSLGVVSTVSQNKKVDNRETVPRCTGIVEPEIEGGKLVRAGEVRDEGVQEVQRTLVLV